MILEPNFTKSERKVESVLKYFFGKWLFWWAKKDGVKEKILSVQEDSRKRKMVIKI